VLDKIAREKRVKRWEPGLGDEPHWVKSKENYALCLGKTTFGSFLLSSLLLVFFSLAQMSITSPKYCFP